MFITFEGIDGCGKSTQLNLLKEYLMQNNFNVVTTREPGGTELSEQIRNILLSVHNEISPITELLLFEASRSHLVETIIKPALDKNMIVLSDRFFDSTVAYQGYGRGLELEQINYLNNLATNGIVPTLTFYLEIPLEISLKRRKKTIDRIEDIGYDFFQNVADGFRKIAELEPQRIITIDASCTKEATFDKIVTVVNERLKNHSSI